LARYEHVFRRPSPVLEIDEPVVDGDSLKLGEHSLEVIWTPGHAREHLCLHDPDRHILFSGDHILPKITSHVSLHTYQDWDPLNDYLASLNKVRGLPVDMVLPGHERIFVDLDGRIEELENHHETRCREILRTLKNGAETAFEVASQISWDSSPWHQMRFWTKGMAASETYAHLVYLRNKGRVTEETREGVLIYTVV
jgi:glyoxylase-like metal-dependent hydrolase (beta-lactamase superfamily II)